MLAGQSSVVAIALSVPLFPKCHVVLHLSPRSTLLSIDIFIMPHELNLTKAGRPISAVHSAFIRLETLEATDNDLAVIRIPTSDGSIRVVRFLLETNQWASAIPQTGQHGCLDQTGKTTGWVFLHIATIHEDMTNVPGTIPLSRPTSQQSRSEDLQLC